jgi:tRNA 5-methylaminomethyl-2-thiouridine biosynthesis bifunctional protein
VLDWQDGQPVSRRFGDVYFSRAGGLEETRHVFLAGNRLPQRFAALAPGSAFVIGETGFGTGLNFLAAWQLFACTAPAGARLHFVSTELDPLSCEELDRALALWPQLDAWRKALTAQYGPLAAGWHRFVFDAGRVCLTLAVGDARETLPALHGAVHAWFLDGFSPARNPELWEAGLLQSIGAHSRPGTSAATYSCAGHVRRGLAAAGFRVWKTPGHGTKREMLRAEVEGTPNSAPATDRQAVVIGAGIAGAAVTDSLARRGWCVTLVERHAALAAGASGNPQGILYARLSAHGTPLSSLVLAGYQHSLRVLRTRLPCDGNAWSDAPVLQLAAGDRETARQAALSALELPAGLLRHVSAAEASDVAGIALGCGGLLFPMGGWVHPAALCRALASHASVEVLTSCTALALRAGAGQWEVLAQDEVVARAPVVVIAAGTASAGFRHTAAFPLRANRGQLTLVPMTPGSAPLRAVLCGDGYVAPARAGLHCLGGSFAREAGDDTRPADDAGNIARLQRLAPALFEALGRPRADTPGLSSRAGLRCTSPDYLPLVGPVGGGHPGLFMSTAHGSRGLITAPLAGEVLSAWLEDEPAPLPEAMMQALLPTRFHPDPNTA